jgi:phage tail-like protein
MATYQMNGVSVSAIKSSGFFSFLLKPNLLCLQDIYSKLYLAKKVSIVLPTGVIDKNTVKIYFNKPVKNNSALIDPLNYYIYPGTNGASVNVISVSAIGINPRYIELTVSEFTNYVPYYLSINSSENGFVGFDGLHFDESQPDYELLGIGDYPKIISAVALNKNSFELTFNEILFENDFLKQKENYVCDNGLEIKSATYFFNKILLTTSDQAPDLLYTIIISSNYFPYSITDLAYNSLMDDTEIKIIGYSEKEESEKLILDIYNFIISSIRKEDVKEEYFLKRFLKGSQEIWKQIQNKIFELEDLWNVSNVKNEYLPYLQTIVGWTGEYKKITDELDSDTLRRLIAVSSVIWKEKGPEKSLQNVLSLATGAKSKILNWFDMRWILGENYFSEERENNDSIFLELPGIIFDENNNLRSEYFSNLRIVDDGSLNKNLVVNIVKLMRACSERYLITYTRFLDQFLVDNDTSDWVNYKGSNLIISGGLAKLIDTENIEHAFVNKGFTVGSHEWENKIVYAKVSVNSSLEGYDLNDGYGGVCFKSDGQYNFYSIGISPGYNAIYVSKSFGDILQIVDFSPWGKLQNGVWYGIRIDSQSPNHKIYIDGNLIYTLNDNSYLNGTVAIFHHAQCTIDVKEVEVSLLPVNTEMVLIGE